MDRAVSGHKGGNHAKQGTARGSKPACSLFTFPGKQGCCGQGWDTGAGIREEHCLAEVGSTVCFWNCPFPHQGADCASVFVQCPWSSKELSSCADQDLPASSTLTVVNWGKMVNHRKSDNEIATYTQKYTNRYHLCSKPRKNSLLLDICLSISAFVIIPTNIFGQKPLSPLIFLLERT